MAEGHDNRASYSECRLCMKRRATCPIFADTGMNIPNKIWTVLKLRVTEDDPLPKNICFRCLEKLNTSYEFVMAVRNNQPERIRALWSPYNNR